MQTPFMPAQPLTDDTCEQLREDGNFIGGMLIILVTLLSFGFTAVTLLLAARGWLAPSALAADDLNMGNTGYLLFYMGVYTLCMALPSLLGMLLFRRRIHLFSPAARVAPGTAASGLAIGFAGCMAANMAASYVSRILENFGIPAPDTPELLVHTPLSLALNLLVMAVLPALLEELLFRVCILQTLRRYGDRLAIVVSALLFGLMHGGISQSVFAFLVGLVLGWLVVNTGNVWIAVLLHFFNNAVSVLLEYAGMGLSDIARAVLYTLVLYGLALIGLIVLVICAVRHAPVLHMPPRGRWRAGACTAAIWKTPLMIVASILLLLRVLQSTLL